VKCSYDTITNIERRRAIKKVNQRGLPGWLLFYFLEGLVGLGDAIAFIFRVKL
jgi:hypothetical protein